MRTKLRLYLADVRKQIEDLEELLKEDDSAENVEAHRKLVEYEKKLKEQYENITGMSIERANKLERKGEKLIPEGNKAPLTGFLGLVGGLLIAWGFYNTILQSIVGFSPVDLYNYFMGTGASVAGLDAFMSSLYYEPSFSLVTIPIGVGAFLVLFASIVDTSRSATLGVLEGLGILLTTGFLSFILFLSTDAAAASRMITDLIYIYSIVVIVSGFFITIAAFGQMKTIGKFLNGLAGILITYSGVQYLLLATGENVSTEIAYTWPWTTVPIVIGATFLALNYSLKIFMD